MKLKRGDNLTLVGFERFVSGGGSKELSKIIFETITGNKLVFKADGEPHQEHYITVEVPSEKKLEEELDVP